MDSERKTDEFDSFNSILHELIEYGLISEIERRKIVFSDRNVERRGAIDEILKCKSQNLSSIIMKIFEYFNINGYGNNDISSIIELDFEVETSTIDFNSVNMEPPSKEHALLNDVVINRVFQFLKVQDLLTCRAVCSQWNRTADPLIRKRTKIVLGDLHLKPDEFVRVFSGYLPNIPFSRFVITAETAKVEHCNFFEDLFDFFRQWGKHVKELTWKPVKFFCPYPRDVKGVVITRFIDSAINLSYLNVQGDNPTKAVLIVEWKSLVRIKTVILKDCIVRVEQGTKISPSILHLENIEFFHNRRNLEQIRLNDYLNISGIKVLNLKYIGKSYETRPMLAFTGGSCNADSLTLDFISIEDWNEGENWKVDKLDIKRIPLSGKIGIQYKELKVDINTLDLSFLNETTEKLSIVGCNKTNFLRSEPVYLPQLKHLCVDFSRNICPVFADFMRCLNVENIDFLSPHLILQMDSIPTSVKALKLNENIKLVGEERLILDKLILNRYSLTQSKETLCKIQAKTIVLLWNQDEKDEINDSVVLFLKDHKNVEKIIIGEFLWDDWKFEECDLSEKVDAQSKYYEFKEGLGTSISFETFEREMDLG